MMRDQEWQCVCYVNVKVQVQGLALKKLNQEGESVSKSKLTELLLRKPVQTYPNLT